IQGRAAGRGPFYSSPHVSIRCNSVVHHAFPCEAEGGLFMSRSAMRKQKARDGDRLALWVQLPAGMAVFGSATPVSKIVTGAMPVFVGAGLRVALGAVVLLPLALRRRDQIAGMSRRDWTLVV